MDDVQESPILTFIIKPDGWGQCEQCGKLIKGLNELATARIMADHLRHKHSIIVDLDGDVVDHGEDEYASPTFIPPKRNGYSVMTPTRQDYGAAWV